MALLLLTPLQQKGKHKIKLNKLLGKLPLSNSIPRAAGPNALLKKYIQNNFKIKNI